MNPDYIKEKLKEIEALDFVDKIKEKEKKFEEKKSPKKKSGWNGPIEWMPSSEAVPDELVKKPRKLDFENFRIYVNEKDFFYAK